MVGAGARLQAASLRSAPLRRVNSSVRRHWDSLHHKKGSCTWLSECFGYAAYQRKGIFGFVVAIALVGIVGYQILSKWIMPSLGDIAGQTHDALRRYEESPSISMDKAYLGKDHQFDFQCKRCSAHVRMWALVDPRYTIPCTECGLRDRINLV